MNFSVYERNISVFTKKIFTSFQPDYQESNVAKVPRKSFDGFRPLLSESTKSLVSSKKSLLDSERVISNEQNCTDPSFKCAGT